MTSFLDRPQESDYILLTRAPSGLPGIAMGWQSWLPTVSPDQQILGYGTIGQAVAQARTGALALNASTSNLKLKVQKGTLLTAEELFALIEENNGPEGLDLSGCLLKSLDLSRGGIQTKLPENYDIDSGRIRWVSGSTGGVNLQRICLRSADLSNAELERADLYCADLRFAKLWQSKLQSAEPMWADFRDAEIVGANLSDANLTGACFQGTRFLRVDLTDSILKDSQLQDSDLQLAKSLRRCRWIGAILDRTRIRGDQLDGEIGDESRAHASKTGDAYHEASEAYLVLKNNFSSIGRYEDAAWAYVKEQQMEKMAYYWAWRIHKWRIWKGWAQFWRWLRNWSYEGLTGYGERWWVPILWALGVIFVFAIIFALTGNIAPYFSGGADNAVGSHNFLDALTHSIASFTTIGFNTLEPIGRGARLLTALESALGIAFFALFIFTLGNRMSRS